MLSGGLYKVQGGLDLRGSSKSQAVFRGERLAIDDANLNPAPLQKDGREMTSLSQINALAQG